MVYLMRIEYIWLGVSMGIPMAGTGGGDRRVGADRGDRGGAAGGAAGGFGVKHLPEEKMIYEASWLVCWDKVCASIM